MLSSLECAREKPYQRTSRFYLAGLIGFASGCFPLIPHVHLHVIPRLKGDGFEQKCGPSYGVKPGRKELDTVAEQIRKAIRK